MAMTCHSRALLAAAAVFTALSLQGCGTPGFVYSQCEAALEPSLGQASTSGMSLVQQKCGTQYKAVQQQNLCLGQGQNVIELAGKRALPKFVKQCSEFVVMSVCVEGSSCYKKNDKITPDQSTVAVVKYIQANAASLLAAMHNDLAVKIDDIITAKYKAKFAARAVPLVVTMQCKGLIQEKLGELDPASQVTNVMIAPTRAIYEVCYGSQRSEQWIRQCLDDGLKQMFTLKEKMEGELTEACGSAALAQECPEGSSCAIVTSNADTMQTNLFAKSYLFSHYYTWFNDLKQKLMADARQAKGRLLAQPATSRLFHVFKLPAQHVRTGLLVWVGTGAVVAGAGLLVVAFAAVRVLRKRITRSVLLRTEVSEEELLVDA